MRVLIIEDSAVLRRLIETCLRNSQFEFDSQRLPHSPNRIGGFDEADLVVIGVYQPLTVALNIIRRLKWRRNPPGIVALTTDTREGSMNLIGEAGADSVVKMPFRPDDLRIAVSKVLQELGHD